MSASSPPRSIQDKLLIAISESRNSTPKISVSSGECGLNEVERRLEEALRNFAGNGSSADGAVAEITAGERIDKIGNLTALAIVDASERTAKDIEEAGQAAVSISNDIMVEAQQLAAELRANGKKISEHLKGLLCWQTRSAQRCATLARRFSTPKIRCQEQRCCLQCVTAAQFSRAQRSLAKLEKRAGPHDGHGWARGRAAAKSSAIPRDPNRAVCRGNTAVPPRCR